MSILNLITEPNVLLHQRAEPIKNFDDTLKQLVSNMFKTMDHHKGVGLAGPQVGHLLRLFVVGHESERFCMINPVITAGSGSDVMEEGCLSIPNILIPKTRYTSIFVDFQTIDGTFHSANYTDFIARIIQHEYDHLNGVLITDNDK